MSNRKCGPVYVASSWKNDSFLGFVHDALHKAKINTLDFRAQGRWWGGVETYRPHEVTGRIRNPDGKAAFDYDYSLMERASGAFIVLPAGESVSLEAGWFAGAGLPVVVWGEPRNPLDIMWLMVERAGGLILPRSELGFAVSEMARLLSDRP